MRFFNYIAPRAAQRTNTETKTKSKNQKQRQLQKVWECAFTKIRTMFLYMLNMIQLNPLNTCGYHTVKSSILFRKTMSIHKLNSCCRASEAKTVT